MKTIGIKLADGTFYPVLEEGEVKKRRLELSTAKDNQTKVQIDLYRSETNSMEDAEYLDTLEITNLNPHETADTSLNLSVALDENNELSAEVVDSETGEKSEVQVQLVNRTLAERESSDPDFNIGNSIENVELNDILTDSEPAAESASSESENEFPADAFGAEETVAEETAAEEIIAEGASSENVLLTDEKLFDIPDFGDLDATGETLGETSVEESAFGEETSFDEPAFEESTGGEETVEGGDAFAEGAENVAGDTIVAGDETVAGDTIVAGDDSFETTEKADPAEDVGNPTDEFAQETVTDSTFDLPDFDENAFGEAQAQESTETKTEGISGFLDDTNFDDPIFDSETATDSSFDEDPFADTPSPAASRNPTGSAMDFSDLYDKETIEGKHSDYDYDDEDEDASKKTRVPVIICVVCAIICIIATLLVLFFIPSKYNLLGKRGAEQTTEIEEPVTPVSQLPVKPAAEPVVEEVKEVEVVVEPVAPAVEDKVVVAPTAEIVPQVAAPAKPQKKADIVYRIKWGDTLWDISQAYYKTPWKYPKIAKYNNIKNPDLIISGTDLKIEQE